MKIILKQLLIMEFYFLIISRNNQNENQIGVNNDNSDDNSV